MITTFEKYEGLGNDFLVVERDDDDLSVEVVRGLCDRHHGVGADGVLIVAPARTRGARATMIVRNADGSRPEMCGNGLRCVARFLAGPGAGGSSLMVDTDAGPRGCEVDGDEVTVEMGRARVAFASREVDVGGSLLVVRQADLGNPHAVVWSELDDASFARLGPALATHAAFPQGANAEFARVLDDGSIAVRVWERGVGPTLACGTGACAVAAVACVDGHAAFDVPLVVRLPGGRLTITVAKGSFAVRMCGPARRVYGGRLDARS